MHDTAPLFRSLSAGLALALLCAAGPAAAHTIWLQADPAHKNYRVMYGGHQGKTETYPAEKLKRVTAFDARGNALNVSRQDRRDGVRIQAPDAAVLLAWFDNGWWSKTDKGRSINKPMDEVPGAVSGVHAVKYHKTIAHWGKPAIQVYNQPFELVPLAAEAPRAGEPLQLKVLLNGKPTAGIKLAFGEEGDDAVSDAEGIATLTARKGVNRIWSGQRLPLADDARGTESSIEYSLVFTAAAARPTAATAKPAARH